MNWMIIVEYFCNAVQIIPDAAFCFKLFAIAYLFPFIILALPVAKTILLLRSIVVIFSNKTNPTLTPAVFFRVWGGVSIKYLHARESNNSLHFHFANIKKFPQSTKKTYSQ